MDGPERLKAHEAERVQVMTRPGISTRVPGWMPSRRFTERIREQASSPPALPAWKIWVISGWIGFGCGLVESLSKIVYRLFDQRISNPDLWVNWHACWMAPPSLAVWFLGIGILLSLVHWILPVAVRRGGSSVLIAFGIWSALSGITGLHPWAILLLACGLGYRLGRRAWLDAPGCSRFMRLSFPVMSSIWAALFLVRGLLPMTEEARSFLTMPKPSAGAPNVLMIVLDTVRADSLSLYGYERPTSPRLAEWARRGVRFDQARATTPFTLGTHASLFTGLWMTQTTARANAPLHAKHQTLAEHLHDRGYATAGITGNLFYGSAHYGLNQGFMHYMDIPGNITRRITPREFLRSCWIGEQAISWFERKTRILKPMQRQRLDAAEINREALAWIDRTRNTERPFFLFLNYFDAHSPYSLPADAPQPYSTMLADRLEQLRGKIKHLQQLQRAEGNGRAGAEIAALQPLVDREIRNAYDDGIAWIDRKLDELLQELDRRKLLNNTLIVITSDHGEMLGEHGLHGHGNNLYRQVVHVPLVLIGAQGMNVPQGETVSATVSLRDVPATILDLLGDPHRNALPGQSLSRFWERGEMAQVEPREAVVSEAEHLHWIPRSPRMPSADGPMWLVTKGRWSYHLQEHEQHGRLESLFDLAVDPGETRNLVNESTHEGVLAVLREHLEAHRRGVEPRPAAAVTVAAAPEACDQEH
jgi:arylsulfatase A-like enzyme